VMENSQEIKLKKIEKFLWRNTDKVLWGMVIVIVIVTIVCVLIK